KQAECDTPDIIFTLSGGLPTGEKQALNSVFQGGLGTGFASLNGQLLFVHTYDPVIVYYGVGYNHYFPGDLSGVPFHLGDIASYQLGVGFAANDRVVLSASFLGAYVSKAKLDHVPIVDSQQEPMRMRFAVTINRRCKIIEPFAEIGASYSYPAARFG